jgi:pimeloyl-ACP methyl ester carboxylesterase
MLTKVVETRCGPVEYSDAGAGDPILYFHGTGITGDVMVDVESPLVDEGFRLIAPNRPGYGRTPLSPHRTAADCAGVAAALLDSLGIAGVSVMGSSGGAAFATSFATRYPLRTTSLVLLCPQVHRWDRKRWLPATSRWTLPLLRRPLLRKLLLKLYRVLLRRMTAAQFLRTETGDRYSDVAGDPACQALAEKSLAAMAQSGGCPGFENDFVVFTSEDIIGPGGSVQAPTLVIHDEADPMAPVDHVAWFAANCPRCQTVSVHAAGHLIWVGLGATAMHTARVRFLREHARRAAEPVAAADGGASSVFGISSSLVPRRC